MGGIRRRLKNALILGQSTRKWACSEFQGDAALVIALGQRKILIAPVLGVGEIADVQKKAGRNVVAAENGLGHAQIEDEFAVVGQNRARRIPAVVTPQD